MASDRFNKMKSILAELLPVHLLAFAVWCIVLVSLKWDSDIGVPDDIVLTPWYETQQYQDKYDQLVRLNEEHEKAIVKMQSLQNRFTAVSKTIEKVLLEYEDHPLWKQPDGATNFGKLLFAHTTNASFHVPTNLRQLLEIENLEDAYPLENSLRPAFREAAADLQQNMELGGVDWKGLAAEFKAMTIPERPLVPVLPSSCEAMANNKGTDETSPTEEDLNEQIQSIREFVAKRWQVLEHHGRDSWQLPFSFENTVQRQQAKREIMLTELEANRLQIAKEKGDSKSDVDIEENNTRQCIMSQEVLPWLEDGLDAYFRGRDPRQAILRRVIEAYPTVDTTAALIDLPPEENSEPRRAVTRNLRQLLDSPMMMESARGINKLIDSMGGYSDWFDQYIDGLDVDNIGTVVIHAVLQKAGRVKIPAVPEFIERKLSR